MRSKQYLELSGRTVLITGASSGIGAEFARQLARRGANLILAARRVERMQSLATEIAADPLTPRGSSINVMAVDLSKRRAADGGDVGAQGYEDLADFIRNHEIEILVNNAGRGSFGRFETLSLEEERALVVINAIAPQWLTHAVIPQMKARRRGAIIAISSVVGFQPMPFMSTYAATKAFDLFHALGLRYELAPHGVRMLVVCPGPVATEFGSVAGAPGSTAGLLRADVIRVVGESLHALDMDRAIVVPSRSAKFLVLGSRLLPVKFRTRLMAKLLRPA